MSFLDMLRQEAKVHFINEGLEEKITEHLSSERPILVGVCGESASGKTTLFNRLREQLPTATFISTDNYYKDMREAFKKYGSFSQMVEAGYPTESSEAFQTEVLRRDLENIKNGQSVLGCAYDMKTGESKPEQILYKPSKLVFAEGICTFYDEIRDMFDVKVYLTVDKEVQKERYFKRVLERGHRLEDMEQQFKRVSESAEKYIRIHQKYADLVMELYPKEQAVRKISRQFYVKGLDKEKERI
ncbi:MAG: hypothetical protein IJC30_01505 [Alphaproteobacteria bacterium]|nr:hypothetical protein [Alphaproteobacteria bacterium]